MLLLYLLLALLGMGSHNFVAPSSDDFVVYLAGEHIATFQDQGEAEEFYRRTIDSFFVFNAQACIRAEEFASYRDPVTGRRSHVRPNGHSFFTVLPGSPTNSWEIAVWWSEPSAASLQDAIDDWLTNIDANGNFTHRHVLYYRVSALGVCVDRVNGAVVALGLL